MLNYIMFFGVQLPTANNEDRLILSSVHKVWLLLGKYKM